MALDAGARPCPPRPRRGLTAEEAAERLRRDGPNQLPIPARTPAWRRLAAEMVHFFALLFWVAGALAFIAGLPQLLQKLVIGRDRARSLDRAAEG